MQSVRGKIMTDKKICKDCGRELVKVQVDQDGGYYICDCVKTKDTNENYFDNAKLHIKLYMCGIKRWQCFMQGNIRDAEDYKIIYEVLQIGIKERMTIDEVASALISIGMAKEGK